MRNKKGFSPSCVAKSCTVIHVKRVRKGLFLLDFVLLKERTWSVEFFFIVLRTFRYTTDRENDESVLRWLCSLTSTCKLVDVFWD